MIDLKGCDGDENRYSLRCHALPHLDQPGTKDLLFQGEKRLWKTLYQRFGDLLFFKQ